MATSAGRRKRVSKNKKKNWRKHVNIDEIEEYLVDKRLQERTGGLVAEKSNSNLFFIETSGHVSEPAAVRQQKKPVKSLRCYRNLEPDALIKPARVKHNLPRNVEKHRTARLKTLKKKKTAAVRTEEVTTRGFIARYDLWGDDVDKLICQKKFTTKKSDLEADEHYLREMNKFDIKLPNTGTIQRKPSALQAIEIPHPGASYNPTYDDHQELLNMANAVEMEKEKVELRVHRALDQRFPEKEHAPTEASRLKEMSVGVFCAMSDDEEEEKEEEVAVVSGGVSYNPPVRREDKKTITQRNKEKRVKLRQKERDMLKQEKMKKNEIFRLRTMKREVAIRLKVHAERVSKKSKEKADSVYKTKKLGKLKFQVPELDLLLSNELEGSLRLLKPEGSLMQDRYKSLQKRNFIEPREKVKMKRRYKLKSYEKKGHREITL